MVGRYERETRPPQLQIYPHGTSSMVESHVQQSVRSTQYSRDHRTTVLVMILTLLAVQEEPAKTIY